MVEAARAQTSKLVIKGAMKPGYEGILTPEVCAFVEKLAEQFTSRRDVLLAKRVERQQRIDAGEMPDFRADTKSIREGDWKVAPIPKPLLDRRVEITGPVERKMIINALNSGAKVFMGDFEDALSPTWEAVMGGQVALHDYANGTLSYTNAEGKQYTLNKETAVFIARPRGWHLDEKHITLNGRAVPGGLVDFGIYFFLNAKKLIAKGVGPYFYIPKLESMEEAQLWADVFAFAEKEVGLPKGSVKATVLIETILAAFEMDEILYALKDYCVALNCGRWDYIFSFIKKFSKRADFVMPDRAQVTMTSHFLKSYSLLLVKTCHKRGAFAMGGMSAFIPVKNDEAANQKAFDAVKLDKERECTNGHDGTWVAHPGLVPVAMEVFERMLKGAINQADKQRDDMIVAADLLAIPQGSITEAGLRNNISVGVQYVAAWLNGAGAVPIFNLMEDAATAEISRSQIWQWIRHGAKLDDGRVVTLALYKALLPDELAKIKAAYGAGLPYERAAELLTQLVADEAFAEFLTIPGYALID